MKIKITDIKIYKFKKRGALLGYANVVINDSFIIRGIKILETEKNGRFLGMPSRRLKGEKASFRDLCHPINQDTRQMITEAVLDAYEELEENEDE